MLTGSELALDRPTIERSRNREIAIMAKASMQGYKFIRLGLKNIRRRRIVGVDAIVATEYPNNEMGGVTDYYIEVRGGEINFEYRPELNMYVFDLLDTERNREFLASHATGDFWEIMDKRVETDVLNRAELLSRKILEGKPLTDIPKQFWKEVRASEEQALRAARGDIDIPKPTVIKENPADPKGVPIAVPYEPAVMPTEKGGIKGVNRGPELWRTKSNAERKEDLVKREEIIQESIKPPMGAGVIAP